MSLKIRREERSGRRAWVQGLGAAEPPQPRFSSNISLEMCPRRLTPDQLAGANRETFNGNKITLHTCLVPKAKGRKGGGL